MGQAVQFMRERGIGLFYFALNPGSEDTGGLLKDDFTTPITPKLELRAMIIWHAPMMPSVETSVTLPPSRSASASALRSGVGAYSGQLEICVWARSVSAGCSGNLFGNNASSGRIQSSKTDFTAAVK